MEINKIDICENNINKINAYKNQISVLLNILNTNFNYSNLDKIDNIYIPLKYFLDSKYSDIIKLLQEKFKLYIYMPTIIKGNYTNLFSNNIEQSIKKYNIKGFVLSNISNLKILENALQNNQNKFELISNYTFNIFNKYSTDALKNIGINRFTISPESNKEIITSLCNNSCLPSELIVYGNIPLMNMNYCLNGKSNKCYPECSSKCNSNNKYYLKDRLNMNFRILFDNIQTVSTIYNSKITSISPKDFNTDSVRIDILDENITEINNIVNQIFNNKRLEGKDYTNGNMNREI